MMGVSVTDTMHKVRPQTNSDEFPPNDEVHPRHAIISAARNEFEGFQVVLNNRHNTADWTGLAVSLPSDLTGPGGAIIPASAVRIYREDFFLVARKVENEGIADLTPEPLVPQQDEGYWRARPEDPVSLIPAFSSFRAAGYLTQSCGGGPCNFVPRNEARTLWVEVVVPQLQPSGAELPAGAYTGSFTVSWGTESVAVTASLSVQPFSIPAVSSMNSLFVMGAGPLCTAHGHAQEACLSGDDGKQLTLRYGRMLLDHRVSAQVFLVPHTDAAVTDPGANMQPYRGLVDGTDALLRIPRNRLNTIGYPWYYDTTANARLDAVARAQEDKDRHAKWAATFSDAAHLIPGTNTHWQDLTVDYICDEPHLFSTGPGTCRWTQTAAGAPTILQQRAANAKAAPHETFRTLVTTSSYEMCASDIVGTGSCHVPGWANLVNIMSPVVPWVDDRVGRPPSQWRDYGGPRVAEYTSFLQSSTATSPKELWWYQSCAVQGCVAGGADSNYDNWTSYRIDSPSMHQHRGQQWLAFLYGVTGEFYWDTTAELATAWSRQDGNGNAGTGDGTLLYPGTANVVSNGSDVGLGTGTPDIPLASIRLKMIREGMEDYEYLKMSRDLTGSDACARRYASPLFATQGVFGTATSEFHSYNAGKAAGSFGAKPKGQDLFAARSQIATCVANALAGGSSGHFSVSLVLVSNAPMNATYRLDTALTSGSVMQLSVTSNIGTWNKQVFSVGDPGVFLTVSACPVNASTPVQAYVRNTTTQEVKTAANVVPQTFSLSVSPSTLSIPAGGAESYVVTTNSASGTGQLLTLGTSGLPANVTPSWDTSSISAGQSATLTLSPSSTASRTTTSFSIEANGCEMKMTGASVTVTAPVGTGQCMRPRVYCACVDDCTTPAQCGAYCG